MLGNNYLKINGVTIPNPKTFEPAYATTETIKTSEAGTDIVIPTRYNKRTIAMNFQVTSTWKNKLLTFTERPTVTLTYKNEAITGRLRADKAPLKEGSEHIKGTDGLWTLSMKFFES